MATFSNNMIINKSSLIEVSKELIDKRTYKAGTITFIGELVNKDGIVSNYTDENYLIKQGLTLESEYQTTSFIFEGTIGQLADDTPACALKLQGEDSIYVYADHSSWKVLLNDTPILTLSGLVNGEEKVKFNLTFSQTECSLTIFKNKIRYFASVLLDTPIAFSSYTTLVLGTDGKNLSQYWKGTIDLTELAVSQNGSLIYTPSTRTIFIFTNILISDGEYPLKDNSSPILDHIFSLNIKEVSRTGNNILLSVTIPQDIKLNIKEIGLYAKGSTGESRLFSVITGLTLEKGTELEYDLIMNVNLDVNVVNTVAFPEIKVVDSGYASRSEFDKVKEAFIEAARRLQRMVLLNNIGVGTLYDQDLKAPIPDFINDPELLKSLYFLYDLETPEDLVNPTIEGVSYKWPQSYYEEMLDLNLWEDNFIATENYSEVKKRCKGGYTYWEFDKNLLTTEGSATVSDTGVGSLEAGDDEAYVDEDTETLVVLSQDARYDSETESLITPNAHFSVMGETLQIINIQSGAISPVAFPSTKFNEWKAEVSLETSLNINRTQVILNFNNSTPNQPLILGISNGNCYLNIQEPIVLTVRREGEIVQTFTIEKQVEINEEVFYSWISGDQETNILLKDFVPSTSSILYDNNGEEIAGATITNVSEGTILNEILFPVEKTSNYTINLSYDGEAYKVSYAKGSGIPTEVLNVTSHNIISYTESLYFGSEKQEGKFMHGFTGSLFLNLFDIYFYTYEDSELIDSSRYFFNIPHEVFYTSLTDFYHIPNYNKSYFIANNLEETEQASYIEILENNLTGRGDCIDFATGKGYTLAVKTSLYDSKDKVILAKGNLDTEEFYFILKEENQSIIFELTTNPGEVSTVSYPIDKEKLGEFTQNPITLTITISSGSPVISMYRNNTLLVSKQIGSNTQLTASDYNLVNVLSRDDEAYDERMVIDVVGMQGVIEEEDFIRLNAALNTNL